VGNFLRFVFVALLIVFALLYTIARLSKTEDVAVCGEMPPDIRRTPDGGYDILDVTRQDTTFTVTFYTQDGELSTQQYQCAP